MKIEFIWKTLLLVAVCCVSGASAQGILGGLKEKVKSKVEAKTENTSASADAYPHWARFEVRVSWKEKGQNVYQTRVYYTNILDLTVEESQDREMKTNLISYFNAGIVRALEEKGFDVGYYTSDVKIYPSTTPYASRKEAEDDMKDRLEADRSNERAIYTFVWKYNGKAEGEKTTEPKMIFSGKN